MGQLKRQLVIWSAIATTTAVLPGLALAEQASPDHGGGRHGRGDRNENAKLSVAGRAMSRGTTDSYGLQIRGRSGDKPTDAGGMIRFGHKGAEAAEGLMGEITCLSKDAAGVVTVTGTVTRSGKHAKGEKGDKGGDKKMPGAPGAPSAPGAPAVPAPTAAEDDGTAFLDEIVPLDADEAAEMADPADAKGGKGDKDGKRGDKDGKRGRRGGGELAGKDFAFTIDVPGKPQKFSQPTIGEKGSLAACSGGGAPVEVTRGGFKTREAGAEEAKGDENKGKHRRGDRDGDGRRGRRGWWRR